MNYTEIHAATLEAAISSAETLAQAMGNVVTGVSLLGYGRFELRTESHVIGFEWRS